MRNFDLLNIGKKLLLGKKIPNPALDSELILSDILNVSRENLLVNLNFTVRKSIKKIFIEKINKRMKRIPIAYLINKKEFWKTEFFVNESVLIPRPETELLVEQSLKNLSLDARKNILDIGTGSGCILISILKERLKCFGTCLDVSKKALNIAKYNAKIQHIENRIRFINSNIDKFLGCKYDLIISNPPYIKRLDIKYLEDDVRYYEPKVALNGGDDGFSEILRIIKKSSALIKKNGKLIMELDNRQVNKMKDILRKYNFTILKILKDLSGKDRSIVATKT